MEALKQFAEPQFYWICAGIIFVILEFILSGYIMIYLGIGAGIVSLVTVIFHPSFDIQLIIFFSSSYLALIFFRHRLIKWVKKFDNFLPRKYRPPDGYDPLTAIALTDIKPGLTGQIRLNDKIHIACSKTYIQRGCVVRIIKRENDFFEVELLDKYTAVFFTPGQNF